MENFKIAYLQNKQIREETVLAPTFDVAYKKFRQEKPFVKILKIEA